LMGAEQDLDVRQTRERNDIGVARWRSITNHGGKMQSRSRVWPQKTSRSSRRASHASTLLLLVWITHSVASISPAFAQGQKIRIGYPSFAPGFVVGWIAAESGILQQHGLNAEIIYLRGGQQLVPALMSQSVDIALGSDTGIYSALLEGAALVKLGTTLNSLAFAFAVRPEIKNAASLKGAVLGSSRGRDLAYASLIRTVTSLGLSPERDVKIIPVGAGDQERIQATVGGGVAGTVLFPPWEVQAEKVGLKILARSRIPSLNGGINTTKAMLSTKRSLVKTFLRAYREAARYAQTHKEKSVLVLQKYLKIPDRGLAEHMYDVTIPYLEVSLHPTAEAIQSSLDIVAYSSPKAKEAKTFDFWDTSLLKELDAENPSK
jgi:ABC-type nitrate/sulfonate/bicarbonate transport system substrate-binding protein